MIKVVHLITGLTVGGAETMLVRMLSASDRTRVKSIVVSMSDRGVYGEVIEEAGIPLHTLGFSPRHPSPAAAYRLLSLLRRERPAVLQTWLYHADLVGLLIGRLARVPKIAWNIRCSSMEETYSDPLHQLLIRSLARLSPLPDMVTANSTEGIRQHERLRYRPRRWHLIPNGIDLEEFRPDETARPWLRQSLGLPETATLVGLVARFHPLKGHRTFLEAAAMLRRHRPDVRFVLAGRGVSLDNPEFAQLVHEFGLADAVLPLGERRDIPRITAGLDVATCASTAEAFPNILVEAMASEVICVTTDVGDCAAILDRFGRVVPPRDPQALAQAWDSVLAMSPDARRRLAVAARRRVQERYSLPEIAARYDAMYEELAGSEGAPGPETSPPVPHDRP